MQISILTPDKTVFEGEINSVKVPGIVGQFQVLRNHAPIVSALTKGKVQVRPQSEAPFELEIERGFIEVLNNKISLLVEGVSE